MMTPVEALDTAIAEIRKSIYEISQDADPSNYKRGLLVGYKLALADVSVIRERAHQEALSVGGAS